MGNNRPLATVQSDGVVVWCRTDMGNNTNWPRLSKVIVVVWCRTDMGNNVLQSADARTEVVVWCRTDTGNNRPLSWYIGPLLWFDVERIQEKRPGRQDRSISKYGSSQVYKLYDRRTGKFLRNIGKAGKNSGEYSNVYNSVIDEQNSRVYILSWNAKELLCHDLNTGDLTVAALPFEGMNEVVAWKQDKTWGGRVDSLYVVKDGFLKPIYTMNFLKGDQKTATTSTSIWNVILSRFWRENTDVGLYLTDSLKTAFDPEFIANLQ